MNEGRPNRLRIEEAKGSLGGDRHRPRVDHDLLFQETLDSSLLFKSSAIPLVFPL